MAKKKKAKVRGVLQRQLTGPEREQCSFDSVRYEDVWITLGDFTAASREALERLAVFRLEDWAEENGEPPRSGCWYRLLIVEDESQFHLEEERSWTAHVTGRAPKKKKKKAEARPKKRLGGDAPHAIVGRGD